CLLVAQHVAHAVGGNVDGRLGEPPRPGGGGGHEKGCEEGEGEGRTHGGQAPERTSARGVFLTTEHPASKPPREARVPEGAHGLCGAGMGRSPAPSRRFLVLWTEGAAMPSRRPASRSEPAAAAPHGARR